jgi:DNA polymerase-1
VRLTLLDGHNLLYRAFTSLPAAITGGDGRPIHAVYGLLSTVLRLWRETGIDRIVAAFDEPDIPTFRHRLYPAYQGQRGPLGGADAPEFSRQVGLARIVLPAVGIPALSLGGYEADDIMATLAVQAAAAEGEATIVSTDRDLLQLVRPGIRILVPGKLSTIIGNREGVIARLGVAAEGVTTFKSLAGDASDNIPGVSGIGVKTAASLVNEYGTLEAIYDGLSDLPARVASRLSSERELAFLFREVVTVVTSLDLAFRVAEVRPAAFTESTRIRELIDSALPT